MAGDGTRFGGTLFKGRKQHIICRHSFILVIKKYMLQMNQ